MFRSALFALLSLTVSACATSSNGSPDPRTATVGFVSGGEARTAKREISAHEVREARTREIIVHDFRASRGGDTVTCSHCR